MDKKYVIDQESEERVLQWERADFLNRHMQALKDWNKTHPGQKPPIIEDKDGKLRWINRKERRNLRRKK